MLALERLDDILAGTLSTATLMCPLRFASYPTSLFRFESANSTQFSLSIPAARTFFQVALLARLQIAFFSVDLNSTKG